MHRRKADEHDFSQHNKRRNLRTRSNERRARNRRALIRVRRPKMERRGSDFECEPDERHDDSDRKQRLH